MNERDQWGPSGPAAAGDLIGGMRRDLAARLPDMIENVLARYRDFAAKDPPNEPKDFAAYYGACRAVLGHLEQLLKLARWAGGNAPAGTPAADVDRLIARAEAALEKTAPEP